MRALRACVVTLAIAIPASAMSAQQALPFHPGQWGIEASALAGGSVLRFISQRTAVVLNLGGSTYSVDDKSGALFPSSRRSTTVNLSLGLRRHAMVAPHVVGTIGGGVSGLTRWTRDDYSSGGPSSQHSHEVQAGPFVSVGGQYLLNDHLSVGMGYIALASWGRVRTSNGGVTYKSASSTLATSFTPFYLTLYF